MVASLENCSFLAFYKPFSVFLIEKEGFRAAYHLLIRRCVEGDHPMLAPKVFALEFFKVGKHRTVGHIRSKRIFQNGSESLPSLLSMITLSGRKFVAHLHSAGAFAPDQECTC